MYQIGDLIIYGSQGVCRVDIIGTLDISKVDKDRIYYTLCPIYQDGKIYSPIDSSVFMRPIITYEEAQKLIELIPSMKESVFDNQNLKLLENYYKEFMKTHTCSDLLTVIKTVYAKKVIALSLGKKLGQTDERFMKKAEDLLYGELAIALGIPRDNVKSYIEDRVKELEEKAT